MGKFNRGKVVITDDENTMNALKNAYRKSKALLRAEEETVCKEVFAKHFDQSIIEDSIFLRKAELEEVLERTLGKPPLFSDAGSRGQSIHSLINRIVEEFFPKDLTDEYPEMTEEDDLIIEKIEPGDQITNIFDHISEVVKIINDNRKSITFTLRDPAEPDEAYSESSFSKTSDGKINLTAHFKKHVPFLPF